MHFCSKGFVLFFFRIVPYLVEECQGLDGDVEADQVDQFVHRLHLLVQLGGVQDGVGEGSVDPGQERFHQLCVNLAFLDRHGEEGEIYFDEFGSQTENDNIKKDNTRQGKFKCRCVILTYLC